MNELNEAVTIKAQVKATLSNLKALLKDKTVPQKIRDGIDGTLEAMAKTWDTLAAELDGETPTPELAPVAAKESELISEPVALVEATRGGIVPLKLIQTGWGSSGNYSEAVLKRDGPNVFKAGTHMFIDHPSQLEDSQRPERSLKDLAAVLQGDARWEDHGKQGPGLYAEAKLFSDHAERIREMGPYIGVSIRAMGNAKQGEVNGRKGPIIEAITSVRSVDFVTLPGAGGAVLSESRTAITPTAIAVEPMEVPMTEQEAKELSDLRAQVARMSEAQSLREAGEFINATLADQKTLPAITRTRLAKQLANSAVFVEGKLDTAATKSLVESAANDEMAYIKQFATPTGQIVGMGSGATTPTAIDESKANHDSLYASFIKIGLSESAAKAAAGK